MLFPWVGMLEQVRLADVYVHYDDVQFSKGSFTNRVQLKTPEGSRWMTIPVDGLHLGQEIREVRTREVDGWRQRHLDLLARSYVGAPHVEEMLQLAKGVYDLQTDNLCELVIASLQALADYFEVGPRPLAVRSSALGVGGHSWQRVLDVVRHLGGDAYVSGAGGKQYIDHEAFENAGVRIEYMDYRKLPYPQLHGEFTPFVSALDLVANAGRAGREMIVSGATWWRESVTETS
jgi:hypothetical protein